MGTDLGSLAMALLCDAPGGSLPLGALGEALRAAGAEGSEPARLLTVLHRTAGLRIDLAPDPLAALDAAGAGEWRTAYATVVHDLLLPYACVSLATGPSPGPADETGDADPDAFHLIDRSLAALAQGRASGHLAGRIAEARAEYGALRGAADRSSTQPAR